MTTVHKIVRTVQLEGRKPHYVSLFIIDDKHQVEYRLNKVSRPTYKGSLLFAFDTLDNALAYFFDMPADSKIMACEAEVEFLPPITGDGSIKIIDNRSPDKIIEEYWYRYREGTLRPHGDIYPILDAPQGTVLCKWIVPTFIYP